MDEKLIGFPPNPDNASHNRGKNYLLVIGIDKYEDSNVPPLKNAVFDTERLTKILTDKYEFQLFRALHNEKATKDAILDAMIDIKTQLESVDNLIVFFSGHGFRENNEGFIVPFDGRNDRTTRYISFLDLNRQVNALPMRHFLFILDCCYAGSALKNLGERRQLNQPSRRILAASSPDETAQDGFYGKNSPFTSALAEILEQHEGTELPVKTLHVKLRKLMDDKDVRQVPVEGSWKMDSNRDGEFVFLKKDVELDTWNALNKSDKNALLAFTHKYPESPFFTEATAFIQEIDVKDAEKRQIRKAEAEKEAFERAKKNGTKESLSNFIFDYPLSIYMLEALALLKIAEENAAWKTAKDGGELSDFLQFQRGKHGKGRFADECQKRIDAFRKPTPPPVVEPPKPIVVVPKVETPVFVPPIVVEKPIAKTPQVVVNQPITVVEVATIKPSFFEKYKIHLMGAGVVLMLIVWFVGSEKEPSPLPSPPSTEVNEDAYWQKATTIPDINAYLKRYPSGKFQAVATGKLRMLRDSLTIHLGNVRGQMNDVEFRKDAKNALDKAQAIDPTNADVIEFTKQLK
jgi:Caspase domain